MTQPPPAQQTDTDRKDAAAEPADDLVTARHSIMVDGPGRARTELSYSVTTGRIVLRKEGHTDDKFDGPQPNKS
jgi:hypothetical protein